MQEFIAQILPNSPLIAPVIFILIRALVIIFPPIPNIAVDIPGIVIFGWVAGFIYAEIGIMLGAMVAFGIARRFREPLVKKFVSLQRLHSWESKLSGSQKFWTLVTIRLLTNPLSDYLNYAAGLTTIGTAKFFFSTLIGSTPIVFLVYAFVGLSLNKSIFYGAVSLTALIILILVFRKLIFNRYLSKSQ